MGLGRQEEGTLYDAGECYIYVYMSVCLCAYFYLYMHKMYDMFTLQVSISKICAAS